MVASAKENGSAARRDASARHLPTLTSPLLPAVYWLPDALPPHPHWLQYREKRNFQKTLYSLAWDEKGESSSNTGSQPEATQEEPDEDGAVPTGAEVEWGQGHRPSQCVWALDQASLGWFNGMSQLSFIIYMNVDLFYFLITFCISNC